MKEAFEFYLPQTTQTAPDQAMALDEAYPALAIFGTLDTLTGKVTMLPVSVISSATQVVPPEPGPYAIILRGAGGEELARLPFTPGGLDDGPAPDNSKENEAADISELVPYIEGITGLEIEGPSGVLFQVEAGLTLPAVQIITPNGGEVFGEESITVSWTASDEDGDSLTFDLYYSADNGVSWEPVAQFLTLD